MNRRRRLIPPLARDMAASVAGSSPATWRCTSSPATARVHLRRYCVSSTAWHWSWAVSFPRVAFVVTSVCH